MNTLQEKSNLIVTVQGAFMIAVAGAPALTGYRYSMPDNPLDWLGTAMMLAGTLFALASAKALRRSFTIHTALKTGTRLSTGFPFNLSRNPMYVGALVMAFSWSFLQRSWLAAGMTSLLWLVLNEKIKIEERNLERVFGPDYVQYKARVRRFF